MTISDHGGPIPKKELKRIFESFYRMKKTIDAQVPGSGFGLFLVNKIVRSYHGKINIENTREGTSIIVRLPVKVMKGEYEGQDFTH